MKLIRKLGATSQILQIFIADTSSSTGAGLTGLVFNTGSLVAYYHRDTDTTATAISLVTMTVGTFTSSGFKEIDATNMPGWYQLCPPNAALAAGAASVAIHLKGAANMAPLPLEIDLDAQVDVTSWNGTAVSSPATAGIPDVNVKNINNVAAATPGASGGILISGSNAGTTTLGALTCTGSFTISDGLLIARSSSNTSAITATGNGTGSGIVATSGSGATGDGIQATAASTNGNGFTILGTGTGSGLKATGGSTGHGGLFTSGAGATGNGINMTAASTNGNGLAITGTGTGAGMLATPGATGNGLKCLGGATSGSGVRIQGTAGNAIALDLAGQGSAAGLNVAGGATGNGATITGGATSGIGIAISTTSGDGLSILPTAGNAITATANGTSKHGFVITGGTAGTSDGLKCVAGTGGVDIRGGITGSITGSLSGSVGSVTGAVGSVTAAVGITSNTKKNQALAGFQFLMTSATTGNPMTGLTVTATRSIDGAAFGACANSPVEIANGWYKIDLAAADLNGNSIALRFASTGANDTDQVVVTQP